MTLRGSAVGEHHARLDHDALVAAVAVLEIDAVAVGRDVDFRVRLARDVAASSGSRSSLSTMLPIRSTVADERARSLGDVDRDLHLAIGPGGGCPAGSTATTGMTIARVKPRARYRLRIPATAASSGA